MKKTGTTNVRETPTVSSDSGKVRLGNYTPLFPPPTTKPTKNISDGGKVRIGNYTPLFPSARGTSTNMIDKGTVRMGAFGPAFPPTAR